MKKIVCVFIKYFLLLLFLAGCGTADSISNSTDASSPSGIVMNLEANPSSVDVGGSATITVTLTFNTSGSPAAGQTVNGVSGSGGALDADSGTTDSNGQIFFAIADLTVPVTVTFTVENISASIRINVNV